MTFTELRLEALKLPEEERSALAESLISSLDQFEDAAEVSPAWVAEIQRREGLLEQGKMGARPMDDVLDELERKLDERHQSA
ncbi:MAG: addiction module protein [Candidatus Hydrogenedentes bacterium]|nr:addiction module protein [Candidatus Hydrogenedentota bacterium]